ncbi:MAG: hypothetical protein ABIQ89_02515 [Candidatus Saccharimonadales bacterium]
MAKDKLTNSQTAQPGGAPPLPAKLAATIHGDHNPSAEVKDDPVVEEAIDDITTHEADEVLAAEDAELAKAFEPTAKKVGFKAKVSAFFKAWWHNRKARYGTIAGLFIVILLAAGIPQSRYFVLNNVGVRSSASVMVVDQSTQQPLKNVEVALSNQIGKTDSEGKLKLEHLKLGQTQLVIKKRAFAVVDKKVTVGWGSNPYGDFSLTPTGSQYDFVIIDFMSGKAIGKAEVSAGEATGIADEAGKAVLTVDPNQTSPLEVVVKAEGYRDETISLNLDDKTEHTTKLVPARKHAFVSKRSGKYDLYSIDIDGHNEKLLLAGTGTERDNMTVVPNPAEDVVAVASSRDNNRNRDGFLLTNLNIVDTNTGTKTNVTQSENIQIVDWIGSHLIFVQIAAGASANNPNRMRLISYDYTNNTQKELASSNYFNDVTSARGDIYYAPSEANTGFFRTNPEGTSRVNLLNKSTWNMFRTKYEYLTLSVGTEWYDYKLGDNAVKKLSGAPASQQNRVYQDNSERKQSLWVETRDGKGALISYDTINQADKVLRTQSGLVNPAYWLNDSYVVYRVDSGQETADYAINIDGGEPIKIGDVTNTAGKGNWYYY